MQKGGQIIHIGKKVHSEDRMHFLKGITITLLFQEQYGK